MTTHRSFTLFVLVLGSALAGCSSQSPWLCPRNPDGSSGAAACAAPAPTAAPVAAEPAAAAAVAEAPRAVPSGDESLGALRSREEALANDYYAVRAARERNIALTAALVSWQGSPDERHRERADEALEAYRSDRTLQAMGGGVAAGLSLSADGVAADIAERLHAEERQLSERAAALQSARKANIALVTALQQVVRDGGTAKSRDAASRARTAYETSEGSLSGGR